MLPISEKMQRNHLGRCARLPSCLLIGLVCWSLLLSSSFVVAEARGTWEPGTWEHREEADRARVNIVPRQAANVVQGHPRLFASGDQWAGLQDQISKNDYLESWHKTILAEANDLYAQPVVPYPDDCDVSVGCTLEVARYVQLRIKHWAYAWQLTKDNKWVDRAWEELQHAAGNSSEYFGVTGNNWNSRHFLDTAEFTAAYAYAYDWLYDAWTPAQRDAIMWSIITLGLDKGVDAYADPGVGWFLSQRGNWNCVCNGGLLLGSLAIYNEDPTGTAAKLLPQVIANAQQVCAHAVSSDGSWLETPDYWYFGIQSSAQIAAALISATGSDQGMLSTNPAVNTTGLFRIYNQGPVDKFNYGDCGPEKITATANALMFYGRHLSNPRWTLFQRDESDAADPLSMFWYDTTTAEGKWSDGLELDRYFNDVNTSWASMRSSWTDPNGLFVGMKASVLTGHQTHGDLDAGDFVIDALGERWVGQLCQNDYSGPGYFKSEDQDSPRWLYYRCSTEGQNTLFYNGENQLVGGVPVNTFGSTGDVQSSSIPSTSTAYYITDLSSFYPGASIKRGVRMLDGRKSVLLQDEIANAADSSQWRVHSNATIAVSSDGKQARMSLHGKTVVAEIVSPGDLSFKTMQAVRAQSDAPLPDGGSDLPNTGVTVLAIDVPAGDHTLSVIFSPVSGANDNASNTTNLVPLDSWNLHSHDAPASLLSASNNGTNTTTTISTGSANGTTTNTPTETTATQDGNSKNNAAASARPASDMGLYFLGTVFFALAGCLFPLL